MGKDRRGKTPYNRPASNRRVSPSRREDYAEDLQEGIRNARNQTRGVPEFDIPPSDWGGEWHSEPRDPEHGGTTEDNRKRDEFGRPIGE